MALTPQPPGGPTSSERVFRVMGSEAHILVVGDDPDTLADVAADRLEDLEARWSRFLPDSEVSRLNAQPGVRVVVAPETYGLVEAALAGWELTGGRFDPTLLGELEQAGYDRSFEQLAAVDPATRVPAPSGGADGDDGGARPVARPDIELDPVAGTVRLGMHTRFDPGGIGKGLAADLAVAEALAQGARGAMVGVGGDLRVAGPSPDGGPWYVGVADPLRPDDTLAVLRLTSGAVASSWRTKRTWAGPAGDARHHLIDPRTGTPAHSGLAGVTVVATEAWRAEVLAKAAFMAGARDGPALLAAAGASGLLVSDDGTLHQAGDVAALLEPLDAAADEQADEQGDGR